MPKTIYVVEDMENLSRRKLFRFLGVEWVGTPYWWLSPTWMFAAGIGIAFWKTGDGTLIHILFNGLVYGLLIALSVFLHSIGHWIGGTLAGQVMTGNLVTATLPVNLYDGRKYPSSIHVIRSAGGPLLNLLAGLCLYVLNNRFGGNDFILFPAYLNLLFFVAAMAPIPTLDGGVFVRELRNWRK